MTPLAYVDLRCLQDPLYQFRGIGHHLSSLLRQRQQSPCGSWRLVGLVDDSLPELPPEYVGLVDEVSRAWNGHTSSGGTVFIDGSPMTHDPRMNTRFTSNTRFLNVAVIYDFIPLDWPGYLPTTFSRVEYLSKVIRLRGFDLFFPISRYSAQRLTEMVGPRPGSVHVTGASIRQSLFEIQNLRSKRSPYSAPRPYFFTVGGGDLRKNTETAIAAVRELNQKYGRTIPLRIVGHFDATYKAEFIRVAGHEEGEGFLEFWPGVDDPTLVDLYGGAIATICPSHIEGFDLTLVESLLCGTPVIASACGAHAELVDPDVLFSSDSRQALLEKLDGLWQEPDWRDHLAQRQCGIAPGFHEAEVALRFWKGIAAGLRSRTELRRNVNGKPKVAFLAPYPPQESGVALHTQLVIDAAPPYFSVDLYTDAPRPFGRNSFRDAGKISRAALLRGSYDSIVSVIGNSAFHIPIFEFFEKFGGPVILHDSRLTHIYYHRLGDAGFCEFAGKLLGRAVGMDEVQVWLRDRNLPTFFVEPIVKAAKPLIVHSALYQRILRERYGVQAEVAPFCPNLYFSDEELSEVSRVAARERLGISSDVFLISTFGFVGKEKGADTCIIATELLRGWNIPAELHFVGDPQNLAGEVRRIANMYDIGAHVHTMDGFVTTSRYRDYMLASDAAIQLRSYSLGQLSGALSDCVSAGLPGVATGELAESCDAPAYVLRVPIVCSPLHVAEGLATIWDNRSDRSSTREIQKTYLATHNYDSYVRRLCEILELV